MAGNQGNNYRSLQNATRCSATKRDGTPCGQPAITPSKFCRVHGGKVPSGVHSGAFTGAGCGGAQYENSIRDPELLKKYINVVTDPELLNLSSEVSLVRAHILQALEKITESGESESRWDDAINAYNKLVRARRTKSGAKYQEALTDLEKVFTEHRNDRLLWDDLYNAMRTLDKLVGRENKRRAQLHAVMSTDQIVGMLARIVTIIQDNVADPGSVRKIHKAVRELIVENPSLASGMDKVDARRKDTSLLPEVIEAVVLSGD